jgi:hypothetical protein
VQGVVSSSVKLSIGIGGQLYDISAAEVFVKTVNTPNRNMPKADTLVKILAGQYRAKERSFETVFEEPESFGHAILDPGNASY